MEAPNFELHFSIQYFHLLLFYRLTYQPSNLVNRRPSADAYRHLLNFVENKEPARNYLAEPEQQPTQIAQVVNQPGVVEAGGRTPWRRAPRKPAKYPVGLGEGSKNIRRRKKETTVIINDCVWVFLTLLWNIFNMKLFQHWCEYSLQFFKIKLVNVHFFENRFPEN